MRRLSTYTKGNWLAILGLLTGVLGIILSVYFYMLTVAEREPILLVDPVKTSIVDTKTFPNSTLKVTKGDDAPITSDVSSIRFYFWNNGRLSIKPENILKPITLSLNDPNTEILELRVLKASRPDIVRPVLRRNDADPAKSLLLSFDILEARDGMTCQIIFAGNAQADLISSGTIEGVREIKTNASLASAQYYWRDLPKHLGIGLFGLTFIILLNAGTNRIFNRLEKWIESASQSPTFFKRWLYRSLLGLAALAIISIILLGLYGALVTPFYTAKEASTKSIMELIPQGIKP